MNWDAIGAVGEIIGAIAVVATLFYISIQIRTNNALASAESRDKTFTQFSQWRHQIASDADLARVWREGSLGESLSEDDTLRFIQVAHDHFLICRSAYQRAELAGRETDVAVQMLVRLLRDPDRPALESAWREFIQGDFGAEPFAEKVGHYLSRRNT